MHTHTNHIHNHRNVPPLPKSPPLQNISVLTNALLREYLTRKGFHSTLNSLQKEEDQVKII